MVRLLVLCCRIVFVYSLVISIHNCAHFSNVLLLLNLQLALSLLAWKVSHTFCQLWCLSQDVLLRAAGCAPSEGVQGTAGRGWAVPAWPLGVCVGARWAAPGSSSTDACTACSSNMSLFLSFTRLISSPDSTDFLAGLLLLVGVRKFSC